MNRASPSPKALAKGSAPGRGLRERVGLGLGVLLLACSVALSLALAAQARSALVAAAAQNLDGVARQTARELSFGMERFVREIELQAVNPAISAPNADPARMRQALEAIQRVHPEFAHISVVDIATETVVAATGGIFEGGKATGRPVFVEGQKRLFVADVHDAVKLATLLPRPASGEPLRFLDAAAPVLGPDGKAIRVLGAHLSWEWTAALKRRVLDPVGADRKVEIMLVDTSGKVASPPNASVKVGAALEELAPGAARAGASAWSDGTRYLSAEAPTFASGSFPGFGWRVVVRQPMSVVLAPADRLRDLFLAGGVALGLLAAALGWSLAGRLVKPVSDLAKAAASATADDLLAPPNGSSEVAEVAVVREAFDRVTGEALQRAERLLSELNAVYEGAPVALCVVDSNLRYTRVNRVWSDAFGLGAARNMSDLPLDTHAPAGLAQAARGALDRAEPVCVEVETESSSGARAWQTVLAPLRERGGAAGLSIVATDVTDIRRAERALREADKRKNEFVSMLAHELRNPLAPIANALEVLDRSPPENAAARMREMMRRQLQRMTRLIDDLLDVSRITHGKVSMRSELVSIDAVCESAVESTRSAVEARKQRLEVDIESNLPPLVGDRMRLEQVVCNLLGNASKYGKEGGRVGLRVSREDAALRLVVEDDGQGIEPSFLPHVFELFAQGHASVDRPDGGLGIGLTLVKSLVELHGGEVLAESAGKGFGARFTVRLPFEAQPVAALPATGAEHRAILAK